MGRFYDLRSLFYVIDNIGQIKSGLGNGVKLLNFAGKMSLISTPLLRVERKSSFHLRIKFLSVKQILLAIRKYMSMKSCGNVAAFLPAELAL